jgi:hypothetical protein
MADENAAATTANLHPDGRPVTPGDVASRQAARDAALARAAAAEREAAAAQADRDAADARLRAALDRAAQERVAANLPPLSAHDDDDDNASFATVDNEAVLNAAAQHEGTALLNLHAQAASVQNIRLLIPLRLDGTSTFYARWRETFLLTLGRYSLERHVLSDTAVPASADWARMDCVVRTWLFGTITDDLADTVSEHRASARDIWLAIESQFLGNQATRALYADADFRTFSQGDLSVVDYCRQYKHKAQDLRDLGEPISDRTLVLNIIRGLNERFAAIGLHLCRTNPLPSFLQVRADLQIEELTMAKTPPATALLSSSAGGQGPPSGAPLPGATPPHQQGASGSSSGSSSRRGKRGGKKNGSGGPGTNTSAGGSGGQPGGGGNASSASASPGGQHHSGSLSTCGLGPAACLAHPLLGRPSRLTPLSLGRLVSGLASGEFLLQFRSWALLH